MGVLEPFFMDPSLCLDEEEEDCAEKCEKIKKKKEEALMTEREEIQKDALLKQKKRNDTVGELLRSKGFIWLATSNDVIGGWQQAGNVLRIEPESPWMCLIPETWEGTNSESLVLDDMRKPDGEDWEYKDRRQEIVFIGHGLNREAIQSLLDKCLLTDEEMALGPEKWKETFEEFDNIKLSLDKEEEGEEEECEEEECEKRGEKRKREDE